MWALLCDLLFLPAPTMGFSFHSKSGGTISSTVFVHPLEMCPLTSKSSHKTTIAGVLNWQIHHIFKKVECTAQSGSLQGRQLVQSSEDLALSARCAALRFGAGLDHNLRFLPALPISKMGLIGSLSVGLMFDFAAAFPYGCTSC